LKNDHGGEFQNVDFELFCEQSGINHNFSAPRTPYTTKMGLWRGKLGPLRN